MLFSFRNALFNAFQSSWNEIKVELISHLLKFCGGEVYGVSYIDPATVKEYARRAQLAILQKDS